VAVLAGNRWEVKKGLYGFGDFCDYRLGWSDGRWVCFWPRVGSLWVMGSSGAISWLDIAAFVVSLLALVGAGWSIWYSRNQVRLAKGQYKLAEQKYRLLVENPHDPPVGFEVLGRQIFLVNKKPWPIYDVRIAGPAVPGGDPTGYRRVAGEILPFSKHELPIMVINGDPLVTLSVSGKRADGKPFEWKSPISVPSA